MMPLQLKSILKEINPARIFPVHTDNAELFRKFMRDLKGKVVGTEKAKEYKV
jgi:mRNA degradation ribonuclease J1/J2